MRNLDRALADPRRRPAPPAPSLTPAPPSLTPAPWLTPAPPRRAAPQHEQLNVGVQAFESEDDEPAAAPAVAAEVQAAEEEVDEPAPPAPPALDLEARWMALEGPLRSALGTFLELRLNL
jgi:hypothetical protein